LGARGCRRTVAVHARHLGEPSELNEVPVAPITVAELHRGIDAGQLHLVYQPEVDLRSGHITSVEALVRWRHPERGSLLPREFIPLAESSGTITDLTRAVLRLAAAQAARWQSARWDGNPLPIWVNLSACDLSDTDLACHVFALLEEHGVSGSQIGLEITETAPIDRADVAAESLYALHDLGMRVAIDDFGTGYSSLSHLRHLPIDMIKIDRSFVAGLATGGDDARLVAAMTETAHLLRRVVTAEGVEDVAQQEALVDLGCDLGQGYLYASPQPARCVEILLAADRDLAAFPTLQAGATPSVKLPQQRSSTADEPSPSHSD
jgi:EAL domain-containing protein (putative c-di-GMP-specific phosphodiesterase class I)